MSKFSANFHFGEFEVFIIVEFFFSLFSFNYLFIFEQLFIKRFYNEPKMVLLYGITVKPPFLKPLFLTV